MFAFLQSRPALRLGVELGRQNWVGVLLDPQGLPQQRHQLAAPEEGDRPEALRLLLKNFPLKQCNLVLSLPHEYHYKTWELESREPLHVRYESERWLPYSAVDASFAWHALGPKNTLISSYPTELLEKLNAVVVPLKAHSLAWEIPEMAQLRTLTQAGLPMALLDLHPGELRLAVASEVEFYSIVHFRSSSKELDLQEHISRFFEYLQFRRKTTPRSLLTNVSPDQFLGWECHPLAADYLAIALAQSPAGPHQFRP